MIHTWLTDTRVQSAYEIDDGKRYWSVKATPDKPGGNRFILTCRELPDWSGRCAYAYPDCRDNVVFQFLMQTRVERADAPEETSPRRADDASPAGRTK